MPASTPSLPDDAYARLLRLRTGLRRFERWSASQAEAVGLTPAQHQLLLAVRGHGDPAGPTVGDVAEYLLLRHHSTVGLADRAEAAGLIERHRDVQDHRVVRLRLTALGEERLAALSALHLEELERLARELPWSGLDSLQDRRDAEVPDGEDPPIQIEVVRVYGPGNGRGGDSVLVDRLWPRGLSKGAAPFRRWMKDVAPSAALRTWYGHEPARFAEFAARYRAELEREPAAGLVAELRGARGRLLLMTATKDLAHSGAAVLREVLLGR